MKKDQDISEEDIEDAKKSFWHAINIFNKELDDVEKEISGEKEATDKHIDTHIEELQDKADFLTSTYRRLFRK
jgi:hypothetical protein